jgi:hypothetical protein
VGNPRTPTAGFVRPSENPRKGREKFEIRVEVPALRVYSALVRAQAFVTEKTAWLVADIFQEFAP